MKLKENLKTGRSLWLPELPQEVPHVPRAEPDSSLHAWKHRRDLSTVQESCNTLPLGRSYYSHPSLLVSVALLEVVIITLLKTRRFMPCIFQNTTDSIAICLTILKY